MADRKLTLEVDYNDGGALAGLKQLDRQLDQTAQTAQQQTTPAVGGLSTMMKGALVGAAASAAYGVAEFVAGLVQTSDELVRVSDRTGLSITAVQELGFAAEQSGNSLEQITVALGQMQNRLASGDKSAVGALKAMNLSLTELQTMNPADQFTEIARAIQAIPDPMQRTQLAMDLFGRSGAAILPTLLADVQKLRDDAPKMSEESVRALERIGDAWDWLAGKVKAKAAEMIYAASGLGALDVLSNLSDTGRREQWGVEVRVRAQEAALRDFSARAAEATMSAQELAAAEKALTESAKASIAQHKEQAKALQILVPNLEAVRFAAVQTGLAVQQLGGTWVATVQQAAKQPWPGWAGETATGTLASSATFAQQWFGGYIDNLKAFGGQVKTQLTEVGTKSGTGLKTGLLGVLSGVPDTIASALTGGGGLGGALSSIFSQLGAVGGKALASSLGSVLGSLVPGIGSVLGSLLGTVVGGLFGKSAGSKADYAATEQIKALQAELLTTYGSLAEIDQIGKLIGVDLAGAWGDRSVKGLEHFTDLLEQFKGKLEVNSETAGGFNAILLAALNAGQQVPAALQPIFEKMREMGLLSDEVKAKLLGVAEGTTAAVTAQIGAIQQQIDTLTTEYDSLYKSVAQEAPEEVMGVIEQQQRARMAEIEKEKAALSKQMEELAATTSAATQDEAAALRKALEEVFAKPLQIPVEWVYPSGMPGVEPSMKVAEPVPGYAVGGITRTGGLAMLHPNEAVIPLDRPSRVGAALMRPVSQTIVVTLDGREIARNQQRYLPYTLKAAGY